MTVLNGPRTAIDKDFVLAKEGYEQSHEQASGYVTKALADQFSIKPGDEIDWEAAGDQIRVTPQGRKSLTTISDLNERLRLFDQATARQRKTRGVSDSSNLSSH